jgi:thiol-disulfide isomerase/thioredoxin
MRRSRSTVPRLIALLVLIACLGAAAGQADTAAQAGADAWLDHPLVDVATGESFTVRGLEGSVVLIETMATWCSNCRRQLGHLAEAAATLGGEAAPGVPVAYLIVSVERGLDPGALTAYAERHGLPFRFAVADDALLRLLAERFGRAVLNPPSTPHVIVSPTGAVGPLTTGFSSPDELVARLTAVAAP